MRKLDFLATIGFLFLIIAISVFYFFIQHLSKTAENGEGMAIVALSLFYNVFHAIFAITLFLTVTIGYYKHNQLKRPRSVFLILLLLLAGLAPVIVAFL